MALFVLSLPNAPPHLCRQTERVYMYRRKKVGSAETTAIRVHLIDPVDGQQMYASHALACDCISHGMGSFCADSCRRIRARTIRFTFKRS